MFSTLHVIRRRVRAIAYLPRRDYALGVVQPFDIFPQTGHVETLVTLSRTSVAHMPLPERAPTPWDDQIPEWPSDDRYAKHDYPDFVDPT